MNEIAEITGTVKDMTPAQLGGEIRLLTAQARRMALSYGIQIGYRLRVAHDKVGPHGWAEWLAKETEFSPASASRFEKLYEGYGKDQGSLFGVENNFPTLEKISVSNALRLLAVPEEEREQVAEELDAEHISTRELEKALRERDEARKALQDTTARLDQAQKAVAGARESQEEYFRKMREAQEDLKAADEEAEQNERELKARIKELESRPVEVAVERDETAIEEAAAKAKKAAEDAAKAEADKLREKLEKAQAAEKAAREALEKAKAESGNEAAAEKQAAEKARAEAEELRKKLTAAQSGAGEAAIYCKAAQENMLAAVDRLRAMHGTHPDTAEKLLGGVEKILQGLIAQAEQLRKEWSA